MMVALARATMIGLCAAFFSMAVGDGTLLQSFNDGWSAAACGRFFNGDELRLLCEGDMLLHKAKVSLVLKVMASLLLQRKRRQLTRAMETPTCRTK